MKFLLVFVSLLFCEAVSSEPLVQEFLMHIQLGIQKGLNEVLTELNDWSKKFEEGAALVGKYILGQFINFLNQLKDTTGKNVTTPSTGNFIDSGKEVGGDIYRNVNDQVLQIIASVRGKLSQSLQDVQATYNKGIALVNEILLQNSEKIEELASEFRDDHKDDPQEYKQRIESLLNEFVQKGKETISACCQAISAKLAKMFNNTLDSTNKILLSVESAAAELKKCMQKHPDSQQELIKCATNAKQSISSVSKTDDFLVNMENEILKYNYNSVNESCLGSAFYNILREREELDRKVELVLNNGSILAEPHVPVNDLISCNYTLNGVVIVLKIDEEECPQENKVGNTTYTLVN